MANISHHVSTILFCSHTLDFGGGCRPCQTAKMAKIESPELPMSKIHPLHYRSTFEKKASDFVRTSVDEIGKLIVILGAALDWPKVFQMVTQIQALVKTSTINGTKKLVRENHVT